MSKTPLVVHITEAVQGGIIRHLDWIRAALPERGVRLHFMLSLERTPEYASVLDEYQANGIGADIVPMVRNPSPLPDWRALNELTRRLRALQPDLVHTHSSKAGMLGRRAAARLGLKAIHTPHVFAFEWTRPGLKRWCYILAERRAAHWCRRLVLLSDAQRRAAEAAGVGHAKQYTVIPNGIDAEVYSPPDAAMREAARRRFGLPLDAPVLGMAARFEPQKGVGDFLRAAERVVQQVPTVRILLAGGGSELDRARAHAKAAGIEKNLIFQGPIEHILPFYHALDGFVLASLWEGLPYVILEAQAAGLPVAATRTRGADAVIEDGVSGWLVPVGDPPALAEAMLRLLEGGGRAQALAHAGQERVRQVFTLDRWADGLTGLYHEVLEET